MRAGLSFLLIGFLQNSIAGGAVGAEVSPTPGRCGADPAVYRVIEVEGAGQIEGTIRLEGTPPAPGRLRVLQNEDVCGPSVPDESLLVSASGGVAGAVVELEGISAGKPCPTAVAVLDNLECVFVPRVQALAVGQSLEIRNSDPILHDAHAWLGPRTIFNLGLPTWRRVTHVFTEPGLHAVDCNVLHTWMKAWILVRPHPYVAVTGPDGRFTLGEVPPGRYRLRVWHESLGERVREVEVGVGETLVTSIRYPEESVRRPDGNSSQGRRSLRRPGGQMTSASRRPAISSQE